MRWQLFAKLSLKICKSQVVIAWILGVALSLSLFHAWPAVFSLKTFDVACSLGDSTDGDPSLAEPRILSIDMADDFEGSDEDEEDDEGASEPDSASFWQTRLSTDRYRQDSQSQLLDPPLPPPKIILFPIA